MASSGSANSKVQPVFDDENQTVRLVERPTMENGEGITTNNNDDEGHFEPIANEAAAAAGGQEEDTGECGASMDVEDNEAQASELAAAAPAGGDGMDIDADDDGAAEEKKEDTEEDDRKPSANGNGNGIGIGSPSPAAAASGDVIRRDGNGRRLCYVDECSKEGRREFGWMCRAHYQELNERDPAAAAAAKAAAAATPRYGSKSKPTPGCSILVRDADNERRGADGRRLCDVVGCPKKARRGSGFMCGPHYRELRDRDPAAAEAALVAAGAAPDRRNKSIRSPIEGTPNLEDTCTPTPGGAGQQSSRKKKLVSSAELSSLYDGQNSGIDLAPRRSKRKNPNDAYDEENGGEMGGRYPARKRARTDEQQQSVEGKEEPATKVARPTTKLTLAAGTAAATRDGNIRRNSMGKILCAVQGCSKKSRSESGYMCRAHYTFCNEKGCIPADLEVNDDDETVIIRRPASRATSGRGDRNAKNSPPPAATASPATKATTSASLPALSSEIRRTSHGTRYCAVENCSKLAKGSKTNWMCKAHYDEFYPSATDNSKSGGTSPAAAASPATKATTRASLPTLSSEIRRTSFGNRCCVVKDCPKRAIGSKTNWMCKAHYDEFYPSATDNSKSGGTSSASTSSAVPTSSSAVSSSTFVKVSVMVEGKKVSNDTQEAMLSVPLAPPTKKKAAREKLNFDKLEPLGKPAELPPLPSTGKCQWSFERSSRVLLAKFSLGKDEKMHPTDYEFLTKMMERDDLSVVSEGLVNDLNPSLWNLPFIDGLAGEEWCHRVRRFSRQIVPESELVQDSSATKSSEEDSAPPKYFVTHKEEEKNVSMKLSCFFEYLSKRTACLKRIASIREEKGLDPLNPTGPDDRVGRAENDEELFEFTSHDGKGYSVNVVDDVLYLIDYDMEKLLPPLREDFSKAFKAPAFLPGGGECMMNSINTNGRPSMGPNFYVTPPASFTAFHQDGHGTVDSGHVCLSGYNEVVMLRRMPEDNKLHAMSILNDDRDGEGSHNTLYGLPHLDGLAQDPKWPTKDAIDECVEMNYCPSVFVLSPGQMVHINKGRLHAFRKLSPFTLPSSDCHAELRAAVLEKSENPSIEQTCISVAWDWEFKGVTAEGINREMVSTLESSKLNREHNVQSLAVPETSILFMARRHVADYEQQLSLMSVDQQDDAVERKLPAVLAFRSDCSDESTIASTPSTSSSLEILRGLLPSLSFIVNRHKRACEKTKKMEANGDEKRKVSIALRSDTQEAPESAKIDPWSHGDMSCKSCGAEISQCYMHCDGCEKMLSQDFNICVECHNNREHEIFYQMCPFNNRRNASINHVGNMAYDRCNDRGACVCRNGSKCKICNYCLGCSCRCHKAFTMHLRFMSMEDEEALLQRVVAAVGPNALPPDATLVGMEEEEKEGTNAD